MQKNKSADNEKNFYLEFLLGLVGLALVMLGYLAFQKKIEKLYYQQIQSSSQAADGADY